jgi:GMP synthase (glutamine-hydrolysing)
MKHAVVIRHLAFEDLGSLAPALEKNGYAIRYLEAGVDDLKALQQEKPDLLVVLGGPIGVYETAVYPFLDDEIAVLRERLQAGRPVIGICLGAQLMAAALGAKVYAGHGKEIGWFPVMPASPDNNVLAPLFASGVEVLHWHGDTFDLPDGTTHLARSTLYPNQAFAVGKHALALQFHPEVMGHQIERWLIGHACELSHANIDIPSLRAATKIHAQKLEAAATQVWESWLKNQS